MRDRLLPIARSFGARLKVAEVPPGPPVLQTLVAEVYGPMPPGRMELASADAGHLQEDADGVVDVDWYVEDAHRK